MTIKKSFFQRLFGSRLLKGAALGLAGSLMACEPAMENDMNDLELDEQDQALIIKDIEVRKPGDVKVCWTSNMHSVERGWIEALMSSDRSWSHNADINFVGLNGASWGICPTSGLKGPVIAINPDTTVMTTSSPDSNDVVHMNLNISNLNAGWVQCQRNKVTGRPCMEAAVLHEFGHALGFQHEQKHPDETCSYDGIWDYDYTIFGNLGYDELSVMGYCGGENLSEIDNAGVEAIYGQKWSNPSSVKTADGKLWVFARGTNNGLYYRTKTGSTWSSAWTSLGGTFKDAPVAVTMGNNRIDVFVRGTDDALWQKTYSSGKWQSFWTTRGGQLQDSPAAVSISSGRIDVFVRWSNNHLRQLTYMNNAWLSWSGDMNIATISEAPTVVSRSSTTFDMFFKGMNHEIYHMPYKNGAWGNYVSLGGLVTSAPGAVSMGSDKLRVFVRGVNQHLYEKTYTTSAGWPALWTQVNAGEDMTSGPGAIKTSSTTFSVFSRGEDDDMVELSNTNGTWATSWVSRGGTFH